MADHPGRDNGIPFLIEDVYPLSPVQEGMVFHELYAPDTDVYFSQYVFTLRGAVDPEVLRRAWQHVVDRCPVLRTVFPWEGMARPVQAVVDGAALPWAALDWRGLPRAAQRERMREHLRAERERRFDLLAPPLMRLALARTGDDEWELAWSYHHLLLDGWSISLVLQDVLLGYDAVLRGDAPALPRRRPYRDYIAWLLRQDLAAAGAYWRGALGSFDSPTPLLADRAASGPAARGEAVRLLSPGATAALLAFAKQHRVTVNTLVQGAWGLLLSRYSGEDDVVFGATVTGRPPGLAGMERIIGLFINTLPVRVEIDGGVLVDEWLQRLQAEQQVAREYDYSPLAEVQRWSGVPAGVPLFETIVAFENHPVEELATAGGRDFEVERWERIGRSHYPLALMVLPGERLSVRLEHDAARISPEAAERLAAHLETLLDALVADPARRLADVPLLRGAERARVLEEWNATAAEPPQASVHELFALQAERTPDATAMAAGGRALTYAELECRSNRLARHLRARGVGPEARVGVFMERGPELLVALLGVLKAGGVYLPLDPAYPAGRLAYMLADSGAALLLTDGRGGDALPEFAGARVDLQADRTAIEAESAEAPAVALWPESAAYVIYTSGSTGAPKGVVVAHGNAANLLPGAARTFGAGPGDGVLQTASISFDASLLEIFVALLSGATLHVADRETVLSPERLGTLLRERGIAVWVSTPALLDALPASDFPALRTISTGGDRCSAETAVRWSAGRKLVNMYGPTETTIYTTAHPCTPGAAEAPPIGRPVENARVYVLDAWGEPAPVGGAGELYVGGMGVARGYLGRPELTAERFVPDPFGGAGRPGGRLYRTGDRAHWRADGELEFLGRTDAQIKIRGFRIEPGEVEAVLLAQDGVRAAAVAVREDVPGNRRLVAYFVPEAGASLPAAELRERLSAHLPEHMVPGTFVALERLPLGLTGKTDRRALPAPERGSGGEGHVPPRTKTEATLAAIWAETLRLERVGVHDSFFELGGDSILSIQVVSRALQRGLRLTPRQLFERPTVARLAEVAEPVGAGDTGATQEPVTGEAPLTPVQARFLGDPGPAPHHFNQGLLLRPQEALDGAVLARAAPALETHHDALRLRFRREADGGWTQWHADVSERGPLTTLDLSGLPAAAQAAAIEAAAEQVQRSLDLQRGPLLRLGWFQLGGGDPGRVLAVAHHLVVDAVSWRVLLEDLESACGQLARGGPLRLPAKTTSWKAWAERLAAYACSGAPDAEAAYWTAQARAEVAPIPVDDPGAEDTAARTRVVEARLDAAETGALLREVSAAYRTQIDEVLLCALAATLARWTGERRVRVDLEGHGREAEAVGAAELSLARTVGWFTTIYPLVLELPDTGGAGAALKAVKEHVRGVPGRGIGYGLLRYLAGGAAAAELADAPAAEVSFNYLGQLDRTVSTGAFFAFAAESGGSWVDGRRPREHRLDFSAAVREGRLELAIAYAEGVHRRETVERLAEWYAAELRALIGHCLGVRAGGYTPSDFPLAGLDQAALDALLGSEPGVEDVYPLTPLQEGMLFHTLYAPGSGVYVGQLGFVLEGPLDDGALKRAWADTVARHEPLRASFAWEGVPRPVQVVRRETRLPFLREDWRGLDAAARHERLERRLAEDRAAGFDVGRAPLMRLLLARTGEREHQLLLTSHHLVVDGWSLSALFRDVLALYGAYVRGEAPRMPEACRYGEYLSWLKRQDPGRAERYWTEALAGFAGPTPLPTVRPGAMAGAAGHGAHRLELAAGPTAALAEQARRWGVTLSTVVQGAWGLLLGRYAGEDDVVFGATVSGRPPELPGVEEMVGMFINTLPVRTRLHPAATLREYLEGLQASQAEAREYEYAPLVDVQRWSGAGGGEGLFGSLVVYENYPMDQALGEPAGGLTVRMNVGIEQANYPLVLSAHAADRLIAELRYDCSQVEPKAAERLVAHLGAVLEAMSARPGLRLADLSLLRDGERDELLAASRAPAAERPQACVHELIAGQARRTPEMVAIEAAGGESLTYAALEERSDRLAHLLRARAVGPETRVALLLERSPELVVAALAVLRAGGAYVPLDPAYPAERLAYTLEDSGASLLLTRSALRDRVSAFAGETVCLDDEGAALASAPAAASGGGVSPRNAAYVVYTSGSTGRPKGVVVEHASLAATLLATREKFGLGAGEAMPALASPAFDIWAFETFAPLVAGGRVRLVPRETVQDVERLAGELAEADALHAVPALMRELVARVRSGPGTLPRMRHVFVGGDAVAPDLLEQMQSAFPRAQMWVMYGPTEASIISAVMPVQRGTGYDWQVVGRPLPGEGTYVMDGWGNLLPEGVPGELYIGGAGLARGYLGRPELTAERFVPDELSGIAGARLYRTGDRVRRRADGELEFLGRLDAQVKIRGFRIEPGEVEGVLLGHGAVREAVVVVREDAPGQRRLVGYVVPLDGAEPATAELRAHLAARLPEHMVPAAIVTMERLPLNTSGKLDRRALPAPEDAAAGREYVAPSTPTQRFVAEVWAEALGVAPGRVGVDDSFFELGGHSLLLVRVHARLRERFSDRVALIHLFEHRTLGALAGYLDGLDGRAPAGAEALEGSRERGETRRERVGRHRATRSGRG